MAENAKSEADKAKKNVESSNLKMKEMLEKSKNESKILQDKVNLILSVVSQASQGDLTGEIKVYGQDIIGKVAEGLRLLLSNFKDNLIEIDSAAMKLEKSSKTLKRNGLILHKNSSETKVQSQHANSESKKISTNLLHLTCQQLQLMRIRTRIPASHDKLVLAPKIPPSRDVLPSITSQWWSGR